MPISCKNDIMASNKAVRKRLCLIFGFMFLHIIYILKSTKQKNVCVSHLHHVVASIIDSFKSWANTAVPSGLLFDQEVS